MFKVCVLLALAIAAVSAQEAAPAAEAAPEPYSYAYQTDSHSASEQRDPSGTVTGFYTLADADGRERRVEYVADAAGFRAKVATNEVGTKSESPADVELIASEPTPQQFVVYQQQQPAPVQAAPAPQVVYQAPRQQLIQQTVAPRVTTVQQPIRSQVAYVQQPQTATYGYNSGAYYGYNPGYTYGYGAGYGTGYGNAGYGNAGYGNAGYAVGNYNNHLPSQYYRSLSTVAPAAYTVGGANSIRYVSQPGVTTTGVRSVGYGPAAVSYGTVPAGVATSTRTVGGSSSLAGSSNYLVLQKRATDADDKKKN